MGAWFSKIQLLCWDSSAWTQISPLFDFVPLEKAFFGQNIPDSSRGLRAPFSCHTTWQLMFIESYHASDTLKRALDTLSHSTSWQPYEVSSIIIFILQLENPRLLNEFEPKSCSSELVFLTTMPPHLFLAYGTVLVNFHVELHACPRRHSEIVSVCKSEKLEQL